MNPRQIEVIYNETFFGLTLFYRDTNLAEHLIEKYQVGQILTERGFTNMSYKGGGLTTNLRYLIASANAKDLSAINPDASQFGHVLLTANAHFKVLNIHKIEAKTQVFLLEIPAKGLSLFSSATSNIEEQIIEKARQSFDERVESEPVAELQNDDWSITIPIPRTTDWFNEMVS